MTGVCPNVCWMWRVSLSEVDITRVEGQRLTAGCVCLYGLWLEVTKTNAHIRGESQAPRCDGGVKNLCKLARFRFRVCSFFRKQDVLQIQTFPGGIFTGEVSACILCMEAIWGERRTLPGTLTSSVLSGKRDAGYKKASAVQARWSF